MSAARRRRRELNGLFGPASITWRINREALLLLGGGRALLLQVAHPLVAAGVAAHSDFRGDPLGRLQRTVEAMQAITFGTAAEARRAYRRIDSIHSAVRGRTKAADGGVAAGLPYAARDPELLLWVHATLVDTALEIYDRCVTRLQPEERDRYYEESKRTARIFRIPESLIPDDLRAFRTYMDTMLADGGPIRVGDAAREIAASILHPPIRYVPAMLFEPLNLVTVGLLPPRIREDFDLKWGPAREIVFEALASTLRSVVPLLPDFLRSMPPARAAERRVATFV